VLLCNSLFGNTFYPQLLVLPKFTYDAAEALDIVDDGVAHVRIGPATRNDKIASVDFHNLVRGALGVKHQRHRAKITVLLAVALSAVYDVVVGEFGVERYQTQPMSELREMSAKGFRASLNVLQHTNSSARTLVLASTSTRSMARVGTSAIMTLRRLLAKARSVFVSSKSTCSLSACRTLLGGAGRGSLRPYLGYLDGGPRRIIGIQGIVVHRGLDEGELCTGLDEALAGLWLVHGGERDVYC
jgi:hypothetical protein